MQGYKSGKESVSKKTTTTTKKGKDKDKEMLKQQTKHGEEVKLSLRFDN